MDHHSKNPHHRTWQIIAAWASIITATTLMMIIIIDGYKQ